MPSARERKIIDAVIKRAEQACREAIAKHDFDPGNAEFRSGWIVAAAVCEGWIRPTVERYLEEDLHEAAGDETA
jgi:hypothetical protein